MKKINFWDIPNLIKGNYHLTFDGDKKDLRLHSEENFRWGGKTKKEYNKAAKEIDGIEAKGNGWSLYAWYDVSSYEYWMKKMEETNYIQITVSFDKEKVNESELPLIVKALDNALAEAEAIENKYSFDPCPY